MKRIFALFLSLFLVSLLLGQAGRLRTLERSVIESTIVPADTNRLWLDGNEDGIPKLWNPFTGQYDAVKFDYEVTNVGEISNNLYPVGAKIISKGIDSLGLAQYLVQDDSIFGWINDGYLVIPTLNDNYAVINPEDKILRPRFAGAIVNDGQSDTQAEQRMFDFISATRSSNRRWSVVYDPGAYNRGVRDTVFIPNQWNTNGNAEAQVSITGYNARLVVDSFAIGHYLKSNNSNSNPSTINFKLFYQGFGYKGGGEKDGSKGVFFAGVCRSDIGNLKFEGLDTAMVNSFALGNNYHDMWFSLNHSVNFWGGADNIHKTWTGSTNQNSAFNVNRIHGIRFFGASTAKSHIEIYAGGGNSIKDIISEGSEPETNIIIDEDFVPVFYGNIIENVHLEDQGSGSVCIDARKIMGTLRLTDVYKATTTGVDTIFRYDDGGTGYFIVDNVAFPYQRIDGTLDIRSAPKSNAPTYPFTTWFANNIIGYDRRFVIVNHSRNIINVATIAGEQLGGGTFGRLTILGSLYKHATEAKAQRLGNSFSTLGGTWWDGIYADNEGMIASRTGGGFGFEHTNEKLRDDAKRGAAELRWAYDNANHQMYWNWPTEGRNMELDSLGLLKLNKYVAGRILPDSVGKAISAPLHLATDGTLIMGFNYALFPAIAYNPTDSIPIDTTTNSFPITSRLNGDTLRQITYSVTKAPNIDLDLRVLLWNGSSYTAAFSGTIPAGQRSVTVSGAIAVATDQRIFPEILTDSGASGLDLELKFQKP